MFCASFQKLQIAKLRVSHHCIRILAFTQIISRNPYKTHCGSADESCVHIDIQPRPYRLSTIRRNFSTSRPLEEEGSRSRSTKST